jgi:hypothetical protein
MGTQSQADVIQWLLQRPGFGDAVIFLRTPAHEPDSPSTGDLDLLLFDSSDDLCVERLEPTLDGAPTLDLIRLPAPLLRDPAYLASHGLITHRLLASTPTGAYQGPGAAAQAVVRELAWQQEFQVARIVGFLEMGWLTVREVGVTWDFPALALFWLHMAHAACFAAMLDAARRLCPNVYTRPFLYLDELETLVGRQLRAPMVATLALDTDPAGLEQPLHALQTYVRRHCPEPVWPEEMGSGTRSEYRYWSSPLELAWRISTAREMAAHGNRAGAVFYLRYCAYSLARIAMIHQRVCEGVRQPLSFIRPESAVMPDLRAHHPNILPSLSAVLNGLRPASPIEVDAAVLQVQELREAVLAFVAERDLDIGPIRAWQPHVPIPDLKSEHPHNHKEKRQDG